MKRKSLFGPLLLIALGFVLLLAQLRPEVSPLRLFANHWPWILVVWGGFRLLEYLAALVFSRPVPRELGPGAVLLTILLCLIGSAAHSRQGGEGWHLSWPPAVFEIWGETHHFPVEESVEIETESAVVVRNLRGRVRVLGSEAQRVTVKGDKRVRAQERESAEKIEAGINLEISSLGNQVVVEATPGAERDSRRVRFDVELEMPSHLPFHLEGRGADLEVSGLDGAVSVEGGHRTIDLEDIGGLVAVETEHVRRILGRNLRAGFNLEGGARTVDVEDVSGPLRIEGERFRTLRLSRLQQSTVRSERGEIQLRRLPGELNVSSRSITISGVEGPVKILSDATRNVKLEQLSGEAEIELGRGNVTLSPVGGELGSIRVSVERGNIEVYLPPDALFTLDAQTGRGRARHGFGHAIRTETRGRGAALDGTTGQGPLLHLRTGRGNIVVEPTGDAEAPQLQVKAMTFQP